ncbi:UDP-4-amino-4,6-dideoxy-N-acetyl-beta-L-altrosamine N-acetyltransferase [bacterium]|nr:MAG: UDP-4-amino-4,6-dideoxy-N-acetyl-beta-L-altrosamine N-acetyltransferase [bacterium]
MIKQMHKNFSCRGNLICNFVNLGPKEKELVRQWRNHDEIKKCMYSQKDISRKEHSDFILNLKHDENNFYWLIKTKTGGYLGVIYLNQVNYVSRNAYLGIYADPYSELSGKGKLLMGCLKYVAFTKFHLHTLKLEVIKDNHRAIEFYRREGFGIEGELIDFSYKNGRWSNVIIMGLINRKRKAEWK